MNACSRPGAYPCCGHTVGQPHAISCDVPLRARALLLAEYDARGIQFRLHDRDEAALRALENALTPWRDQEGGRA